MAQMERGAKGFAPVLVLVFVLGAAAASVLAHEIVVKGTVAGIEKMRIQVKTGQEKDGARPAWYPIDAATKIKRGDKVVGFEEARIRLDERVVLIVEHPDAGPMKTKEIRLAPVTSPAH
jgi:hypothetical protein